MNCGAELLVGVGNKKTTVRCWQSIGHTGWHRAESPQTSVAWEHEQLKVILEHDTPRQLPATPRRKHFNSGI